MKNISSLQFLSLRGAKRRSNPLITTVAIVIARHEVPKQPP